RAQTVEVFLTTIASFHERYGGFVLETHRDGLVLEGRAYEGGESVDNLALQLYSVGVWQLVILPGLTDGEMHKLLDLVTMEPEAILKEGGLTGLLEKNGVPHVRVVELRPGDEDPANITLEAYHRLLNGSLSAQERAALVGVLRAGPDQAMRLLSIVVERTKQAFADATGAGLGDRVYTALTALDRLIVDTPGGESQDVLKHLATAVTEIDDPQRRQIHRAILQHAAQDLSARALLTAMTSEQIARVVIPCLEAGDPPPQIAQVIQGLPFDPAKARDALALVSQQTGRSFDLPPALEELRLPPWVHDIPQDLADFVISEESVGFAEEEVKALRTEAALDEPTVVREHALAMLDLALADDDPTEVDTTLSVLSTNVKALQANGTYDVIGTVLQHLDGATRAGGRTADVTATAMRRILVSIAAAATHRDIVGWPDDHPLVRSLRKSGRTVGGALAHALADERDVARRHVLVALLARAGDAAVDAIVPLLSDRNIELTRAIIPALIQMRSPASLDALRSIARHPNAGVRRDAAVALGPVPGPEAQTALLAFLTDADPEVCEACLRHLRHETARKVAPLLIALLQNRKLARHPLVRIRIIDLLVQAGITDALPALRKLTSALRLRHQDRRVARYARTAVRLLLQTPTASSSRREVRS
ncbi:MAG TPA: HEAT repeat domain-containing protein, partial [bacterium]|nr:HEAT repeat domain-containing protein [bacterium]